ncbi:MAG: peptide chain release factor 2 [Planctomycetota bacterium]|nr:MAG: peptide chain release factor 2 [Planctomycetota bacterium]
MNPEEIREAQNLLKILSDLKEKLAYEESLKEIASIEEKMNEQDFWDNQDAAQKHVEELKNIKAVVAPFEKVEAVAGNIETALELAAEAEEAAEALGDEFSADLEKLRGLIAELEFRLSLTGEHDKSDAFMVIHCGAGGTDACDWAQMLLRMYLRFLERHNFTVKVLDINYEDEAGIKDATLEVKGRYAFGYLRSEIGVHRLVRISPFNYAAKRHTSFASIDVTPVVDEDIDIEINESDLKLDFFRASGAGGQHVNVTDSAVRITHIPTGVVVSCQNERSQHANRRTAMQILKSRLYKREMDRRAEERAKAYGEKMSTSFGSQIRNYVQHPYRLVKDVRTGLETGNVDAILDGDLMPFIKAYLRHQIGKGRQ